MVWLNAYGAMLPRLDAEDTVRMVNAIAAGFGSMSKEDAARFQRNLDDALSAGTTPQRPRYASLADLARETGLPVERHRPKNKAPK